MVGIKLMYIANIIVARWISITALFYPHTARVTVITDAYEYSEKKECKKRNVFHQKEVIKAIELTNFATISKILFL